MPGLPFVDHDAAAIGCSCSRSRTAEQMCRQQSRVCLTAAEELAAEESLSIYCKPVEFYNILQRRAIRKPSFLQRCLQYKIQAKHKRRYMWSSGYACLLCSSSLEPAFQREQVEPAFTSLE